MADINPRSRQRTIVDAPQSANTTKDCLYKADGITPIHRTQFPSKEFPAPIDNLMDPVKPWVSSIKRWDTVDRILFGSLAMIVLGAVIWMSN